MLIDAVGTVTALHYHSLSQPILEHQLESTRGGMPGWVPRMWRHLSVKTNIALANTNTMIDLFATEGVNHTPDRIPNLRVEYTPISTRMPVGFWRSVGHSFNAFGIESFIDELAHAAAVDPLAFRRAMLKLRYADFHTLSRSRTVAPTNSELELYPVVKQLLVAARTRSLPVRLLGIKLSNLGVFEPLARSVGGEGGFGGADVAAAE